MRPRILFNPKDHPDLNSGYGIASRYLLPYLGDRYGRENIIIYPPIYQRDHIAEWNGMAVVSGTEWGFGENMVLDHYKNFDCNLYVQVGDTWPLGLVPDLAAQDKILWVQWIPVDWLGMPKNIINRIKPAHKLVSFSKYGENNLRKGGLPNVEEAIWLGLNTDLWKPMDRESLPHVMDRLGYQLDTFNILIVAANQNRKQVRPQLEAISIFRKSTPQANIRLYIHSFMVGERDLRADLNELGLDDINVFPEPYILTQGGFAEDVMVKVFNCADVVMNVCMEGFGYAQAQAQACGVPVICLSEGAGPELVTFGVETPPAATETSAHQMTQPIPNPLAIAVSLKELWQKRVENGAPLRSEGAVRWVQENLGWDCIAEKWFKVIDSCMEDRVKHCMDIPEPAEWLSEKSQKAVELT